MSSSNGNIFRVTGHLCGNSPVPGEFSAQKPVTRSYGVFFDLRLNKRLSKQSWGWWFETLSCPFWRQRNEVSLIIHVCETVLNMIDNSALVLCFDRNKATKYQGIHSEFRCDR